MSFYDNGGYSGGTSSAPAAASFPHGQTSRGGAGLNSGAVAPTLTADSAEVQIIASPGSAQAVSLPSTNVKAGKMFKFYVSGATETNYVSLVATTEIDRIGGTGIIEIVALQDTPTLAAHWKVLDIRDQATFTSASSGCTTGGNIVTFTFTAVRNNSNVVLNISSNAAVTTINTNATAPLTFTTAVPVRFRPTVTRSGTIGNVIDASGVTNRIEVLAAGTMNIYHDTGATNIPTAHVYNFYANAFAYLLV